MDKLREWSGDLWNHVAVGTDFDGFTDPPDDCNSEAQLPLIRELLEQRASRGRTPTPCRACRPRVELVRAFYGYTAGRDLAEAPADEQYVAAGHAAFGELAAPDFEFVLVPGEGGEQGSIQGQVGW
jgi:hypothetical protein